MDTTQGATTMTTTDADLDDFLFLCDRYGRDPMTTTPQQIGMAGGAAGGAR